jgi:hypothetical protein
MRTTQIPHAPSAPLSELAEFLASFPSPCRGPFSAKPPPPVEVETARHWLIALSLMAFKVALSAVAKRPISNGPAVQLARFKALARWV